MPRGLSTTVLPVENVAKACFAAIAEIEAARLVIRKDCEADWIKAWREQHPIKSMFTDNKDVLPLMPEYYKLWKEHREDDESVLNALALMSSAASAKDMGLTVVITADDFRLIAKHYDKGE